MTNETNGQHKGDIMVKLLAIVVCGMCGYCLIANYCVGLINAIDKISRILG